MKQYLLQEELVRLSRMNYRSCEFNLQLQMEELAQELKV